VALVLVVEDEQLLRSTLEQRLEMVGHEVHGAETLEVAADHLKRHRPDLMLLDLSLPDGHGLDFYEANADRLEETVVLIMTAVGQVEDAVRAMKLGALDFLSKPIAHKELVELVNRSLEVRTTRLEAQVARRMRERELDVDIVSRSSALRRTMEIAGEAARSDIDSLLIRGESGTGKNVVARYIHSVSERHPKPFLEVNCAAIPDQLVESELFGHERGAFTDAKATKVGTLELADGGTVVLDEIGELRLDLQAKLLHFLDERRFRRVGGTREIRVDLRVIGVTNRDIKRMVQRGKFRGDLYFRLSVFPIEVPPLRDRHDDILPLAKHFLRSFQSKYNRTIDGLTREVENELLSYSWPGNVRELRNVLERAVILEKGAQLTRRSLVLDRLDEVDVEDRERERGIPEGIVPLDEVEAEMLRRAMRAAGDNQTRAAELLGISRDQLRYRCKKLGV